MPRVHNITNDDLDCPALGLAVPAGGTVEITDEQAAELAPVIGGVTYEHALLKVLADESAPKPASKKAGAKSSPTTPGDAPAPKE